jgi:hypothetical protein
VLDRDEDLLHWTCCFEEPNDESGANVDASVSGGGGCKGEGVKG